MAESGRVFERVYHDTPRRRLTRAGATLARRVERGRSSWRLEVPRSAGAPLEVEAAGGPVAPKEICRLLGAFLRGDELEPALRMRVARNGGTEEVEVLEGLRHAGALSVTAGEERTAALGLLDRAPKPRDAAEAGARLRSMLRRQYVEILRHDPAVRLALDPEDLHRMRVAVRRARAILRAVRPAVDTDWSEPLRAELKWLGGVLGPRRDLDVLIERLREEIAGLDDPERTRAGSLLVPLKRERRGAQAQVSEALASERYWSLLDELEARAEGLELSSDVSLSRLAGREFRRLRSAMKALTAESSDEELHRVRILGKRARYAAELAKPERGKRARRFVANTKAFQDLLGSHQDAIVAEARLREVLRHESGKGVAFATGRLVEREQARRRDARRALPAAWATLERRGLRAWS